MKFAWHICHAGDSPPMQSHVAKQAVNMARMRTLLQRTCLQILPQQHPAAVSLDSQQEISKAIRSAVRRRMDGRSSS